MTEQDPHYHACPQTDGELLPVVDWDDRQTGLATRREIHEAGLLHRAVHAVVSDGNGRVLLQKRSARKDSFPGWWDISVGGHVGPGETYAEAIVREVAEELGLEGAEPTLAAILPPAAVSGWEHVRVFACSANPAALRPDANEIDDTRWVPANELLDRMSPDAPDIAWRLTPSAVRSLRAWANAGAPGLSARMPPHHKTSGN